MRLLLLELLISLIFIAHCTKANTTISKDKNYMKIDKSKMEL